MRKINFTVVMLTVISIVELIVTKSLQGAVILWIAYGVYKAISD